jgi:hypothetical protein
MNLRIGPQVLRCSILIAIGLLSFGAFGRASAASTVVSKIFWEDNILTIYGDSLTEGKIEIWYLEAFCRTGSTDRVWNETVIPHTTKLLESDDGGQHIRLESLVEPGVTVQHEIRVVENGVQFDLVLHNTTDATVDIDWVQPCMRVGEFTGLDQENYHQRCFIFTESGRMMLDKIPRTIEARYRGGQVYVPDGINLNDVNPRPISKTKPVNGLIGAISEDREWIVAMAWDQTQELFQGVIKCIHNDFRVGGLAPGEKKSLRGRVYLLPNDGKSLLSAYKKDFE